MLKQELNFERLLNENKKVHERRFIHDFEMTVKRISSNLWFIDAQNIRSLLTTNV